jgi:hypothetical protein
MRTGRNQFSQYLTYNPDLRERAIDDRIYHSFKNTPYAYANRRLIVQAVQFSEMQQYTRNFAKDKLKFTNLSDNTRKALNCVTTAGIRHIHHKYQRIRVGRFRSFVTTVPSHRPSVPQVRQCAP